MSDAETFYGQALWYAWGRLDAGTYNRQEVSLDAFEFAGIVRERREEFVTEQTHFMESIQGLWDKYVASKSWREATDEEKEAWLSGGLMTVAEARETEHGLEVRDR